VSSRTLRAWVAIALVVLLAACTPASSAPLPRTGTARVLLGAANDTSTPFKLVSLPALTDHRYDGRDLRITRRLARAPGLARYAVRYRSGRLTVTGVLGVPTGGGRRPVVVLAHGYADPRVYTTGSMLTREQGALVRSGFVALAIDYRNYAGSSRETGDPVARPLGYPADLVNAVAAVRASRLPFLDGSRVGLLGRSMGGGVVLDALAARPHLALAAVLSSPVSSLAADQYARWVAPDRPLRDRVVRAYGTPRTNPRFWRQASVRTYLGRVDVPLQIHHGTADPMCPVRWSEATAAALRARGKDVTLYEYPGEGHRFAAAWPTVMERTLDFLHEHLDRPADPARPHA
jgi:dipeptidyl aminopeptidase/acylaminoacyl peptidase